MKPGTKFKLECEVDDLGYVRCERKYMKGGGHISFDEHPMPPDELGPESISDVREPPEPRERFTDLDGTVYEILREGDTWESGDRAFDRSNGERRGARSHDLVGSAVIVGPGFLVGMRRVRP